MATKIEKKNREPKPKFFDEEILKEVADVADAERKDYDQPQPVKTDIIQQQASTQSERVGAGRPKIERKVKREKAMNVYFDPATHDRLRSMKFFHDIEMKDIPYVLTREFFKKYDVDGKLSSEGLAYIQRLLSEVN